jgi:hypothetical protein
MSLYVLMRRASLPLAVGEQKGLPLLAAGPPGVYLESPPQMRTLATLATIVACSNADFIQTTIYLSSGKCSGQVFQTVSQLVGCSRQGQRSLTVTCLNSSAATADVFDGTDCTGPSTPIDVPFDSSCTATGSQSSVSQCVTGSYSECALWR